MAGCTRSRRGRGPELVCYENFALVARYRCVRCVLAVDCKLLLDAELEMGGRPTERRAVRVAVNGVGGPIIFLVTSFVWVDEDDASRLILDTVDDEPSSPDRDEILAVGVFLPRPPVIKGCRIAPCGFNRLSGSQIRHLAIKSTNSASSQRRTWLRVFVPGRRRRPLEFTTGRGAPDESVKCQ